MAPRPRPRSSSRRVDVAIRLVIAWHVIAALVFAWIAWNICRRGLEARVPARARSIGIGAVDRHRGQPARRDPAAARSSRRARMVSFTVNYLTLILVIVLLFQSLDLASYLDDFAAAFNAAFLPFIGMAIAVAWIVLARRLKARGWPTRTAPTFLPPLHRVDHRDALDRPRRARGVRRSLWLWKLEPWTLARLLARDLRARTRPQHGLRRSRS